MLRWRSWVAGVVAAGIMTEVAAVPATGPDGMHPDPEGHLVLASSVAVQPVLEAALRATCRSR